MENAVKVAVKFMTKENLQLSDVQAILIYQLCKVFWEGKEILRHFRGFLKSSS